MSTDCASVTAFGKIIFIPVNQNIPNLPLMNLLFFNDKERGDYYPWRAVCIDLEIDACGETMDDAWNRLKDSLNLHIAMWKRAVEGSITKTAKQIIQEAYSDTIQKQEYFRIYREVKLGYTMKNLEENTFIDPFSIEKRIIETANTEQESICRVIDELKAA
jgi:hypothetical protein